MVLLGTTDNEYKRGIKQLREWHNRKNKPSFKDAPKPDKVDKISVNQKTGFVTYTRGRASSFSRWG